MAHVGGKAAMEMYGVEKETEAKRVRIAVHTSRMAQWGAVGSPHHGEGGPEV